MIDQRKHCFLFTFLLRTCTIRLSIPPSFHFAYPTDSGRRALNRAHHQQNTRCNYSFTLRLLLSLLSVYVTSLAGHNLILFPLECVYFPGTLRLRLEIKTLGCALSIKLYTQTHDSPMRLIRSSIVVAINNRRCCWCC